MKIMNKLKTGLKIISAKLSGKRIPILVGWDLTSRCNFDCCYCGVTDLVDPGDELGTEDVLAGINQLAELGAMRIHFGGGEVLLRQDIGTILKACKDRDIYTAVLTNGQKVGGHIDDLKFADMLNISFDGPKKVHDKLRKTGSYDAVVEAIKLAQKANIDITLNVTVSKLNKDHIKFILDFAKNNHLGVRFQPVNQLLAGNKDISGIILDKHKYDVLTEIIRYKKKYKNILNSFSSLKYLRDYPEIKFPGCCAGRIYMRISEAGNIFPCSIVKGRVISRSYIESDIKTEFENLPLVKCKDCLCTPTLEACFINSLNIEAILNALTH